MQGLPKHILSAAVVTVGVLFAAPSFAAHHDNNGHRDRGGNSSFSHHSSGGHSGFSHRSSGNGHLSSHQREVRHDFRSGERHGFNHALRGDFSHHHAQHDRAFDRGYNHSYHTTTHALRHEGPRAVHHAFNRFHGDVRHFSVRDRAAWSHGGWRHTRWHGRFGWWWVVGPSWYFYDSPVYPYPGYVSASYYDGGYDGDSERCYDENGSSVEGYDSDNDGYCDDDQDGGYDDNY